MTEYERFESNRILPMFVKQPGFIAVVFARSIDSVAAISFWENQSALETLETSEARGEIESELKGSGMLTGEVSVEVFQVNGGYLPTDQAFEPHKFYAHV